ncbi:MAG: TIGR03067 domain-containing protein [Gemmataceae bacterium]
MKQLLAAVVAGLVVAGAGTAQGDAPAKSIDGTYKVLSASFGGKTKEDADKVEFEFKNGTVTVREGGKGKAEDAKFTLDPTKTPGHIDISPPKGDKTVLGIYQTKATKAGLELTLAFTKNGDDRPADFKTDAPGVVVMKLLRQGGK